MKRQVMVRTQVGRYVRRAVRICPDYVDLETADRKAAVRGEIQYALRMAPRKVRRTGGVRFRIVQHYDLQQTEPGVVSVRKASGDRYFIDVDRQRWLTVEADSLPRAERFARRMQRDRTWAEDVIAREATAPVGRLVARG